MKYNYIVIEGNIGAGKTTLSKMLSKKFNAKLVLEEFADNPFLPNFYKEPNKYAFQLELSFLAERYQQMMKDLNTRDLFYESTISDYILQKCMIFAQGNLDSQTFELYRKLYDIISSSLPQPDILIYLFHSTDRLLQNISKRGRSYEAAIDAYYLEKIQSNYMNYFKQNHNFPILIVDTKDIDFVKHSDHFEKIAGLMEGNYSNGINLVDFSIRTAGS